MGNFFTESLWVFCFLIHNGTTDAAELDLPSPHPRDRVARTIQLSFAFRMITANEVEPRLKVTLVERLVTGDLLLGAARLCSFNLFHKTISTENPRLQ